LSINASLKPIDTSLEEALNNASLSIIQLGIKLTPKPSLLKDKGNSVFGRQLGLIDGFDEIADPRRYTILNKFYRVGS
jgi:hypothetical protein